MVQAVQPVLKALTTPYKKSANDNARAGSVHSTRSIDMHQKDQQQIMHHYNKTLDRTFTNNYINESQTQHESNLLLHHKIQTQLGSNINTSINKRRQNLTEKQLRVQKNQEVIDKVIIEQQQNDLELMKRSANLNYSFSRNRERHQAANLNTIHHNATRSHSGSNWNSYDENVKPQNNALFNKFLTIGGDNQNIIQNQNKSAQKLKLLQLSARDKKMEMLEELHNQNMSNNKSHNKLNHSNLNKLNHSHSKSTEMASFEQMKQLKRLDNVAPLQNEELMGNSQCMPGESLNSSKIIQDYNEELKRQMHSDVQQGLCATNKILQSKCKELNERLQKHVKENVGLKKIANNLSMNTQKELNSNAEVIEDLQTKVAIAELGEKEAKNQIEELRKKLNEVENINEVLNKRVQKYKNVSMDCKHETLEVQQQKEKLKIQQEKEMQRLQQMSSISTQTIDNLRKENQELKDQCHIFELKIEQSNKELEDRMDKMVQQATMQNMQSLQLDKLSLEIVSLQTSLKKKEFQHEEERRAALEAKGQQQTQNNREISLQITIEKMNLQLQGVLAQLEQCGSELHDKKMENQELIKQLADIAKFRSFQASSYHHDFNASYNNNNNNNAADDTIIPINNSITAKQQQKKRHALQAKQLVNNKQNSTQFENALNISHDQNWNNNNNLFNNNISNNNNNNYSTKIQQSTQQNQNQQKMKENKLPQKEKDIGGQTGLEAKQYQSSHNQFLYIRQKQQESHVFDFAASSDLQPQATSLTHINNEKQNYDKLIVQKKLLLELLYKDNQKVKNIQTLKHRAEVEAEIQNIENQLNRVQKTLT